MDRAELSGVTITYWPNKGALMFHGPEWKTGETNGRYLQIKSEDDKQANQKRDKQRGRHGPMLAIFENKNITISPNQANDIPLFRRNWDCDARSIGDLQTSSGEGKTQKTESRAGNARGYNRNARK